MNVSTTPSATAIHTSQVNAIVQINSGQVATGSNDMRIKVWNTSGMSLVNTYTGHTTSVVSLAVLANGQLGSTSATEGFFQWTLATSSLSFTPYGWGGLSILMWNSKTNGYVIARAIDSQIMYNNQNWFNGYSTHLAIDIIPTDGTVIGVGATLDLILLPSGIVNFTVNNNGTSMTSVKVLPDNMTAVVGQTNGLMKLFSLTSQTFGVSSTVHTASVVMLQVTPDSLYLVSAAADNKVILWTWSTLTQVKTFSPTLSGTVTAGAVITSNLTGKIDLTIFVFKSYGATAINLTSNNLCFLRF
jgi:WD40 repeat protein